jgi:hypothetical protein
MKTKPMTFFLLVLILGFAAYLDSPYSFLNINYSYTAEQPAISQPMSKSVPNDTPDSEEKLVKKEKQNGYIVETYREYEVYKDAEGMITKEVPTSQYDELKYWDYKSKKK